MKYPTPICIVMGAALVAASMVLGGCSAQDEAGLSAFGAPHCQGDSDCPAGQMCRSGLCSTRGSSSTTLDFRFIPSTADGFLPQQRKEVHVRAEDSVDFLLRRGVTVSGGATGDTAEQAGGIRYADSTTPGGPSGTLIFRPRDAVGGLFIRQTEVDSGGFNASVNPGIYSVTFVPENDDVLPKKTWRNREFTSNTILSLSVLRGSEYHVVDGRLSRDVVWPGGSPGTNEPVSDARVYALARTGNHSSTEVSPSTNGEFELRVEPDTGIYDLFIVPATSDTLLPSVRFDAAFEALETKCVTDTAGVGQTCSWSKSLGAYPAEPIDLSVKLEASSLGSQVSWEGTTVVINGPLGRGTFDQKFPANADGTVDLTVYPADWSQDELRQYTLEVIPPARSPLARSAFELAGVVSTEELPSFEVGLKQRFDGQVIDSVGAPMASAELEFRLAAGSDDEESLQDDRIISVSTDENGRFEVWLDRVAYDVHITPTEASGQPRTLEYVDASRLHVAEAMTFQLPRPSVLVGSVFGASDSSGEEIAGVGDVTVEAYRVVDGRTIIFGQARTDSAGNYRMVISSEL